MAAGYNYFIIQQSIYNEKYCLNYKTKTQKPLYIFIINNL